jgi:Flp pilus assembly protein TadG
MVEFALVLPVLVVLVLAIAQFGVAFNNYLALTDAARAAARQGAVARTQVNPASACQNAGYAAGTDLKGPGTTFLLSCSSPWTVGSDVTVTASYPYTISLLGWAVVSGRMNTTMKERVE